MAEGRGKAQAASLRATQRETTARKVVGVRTPTEVPSSSLQVGDVVVVVAGETIPGDGDVIEGVASVDESAITGESAPVIRESGGDRSAVTGGTVVLSDRIVVRITAPAGHTFVDRMIALVEGSERQKTPNEVALNVLLTTLTIVFLLAVVTLQPFAMYSGAPQTLIVLVALLVCLIPTTIGALLSAIGIAGMDRLVRRNVLAMSGRAVEAAGDVDVLLLDKTGTITLGNRQAADLLPAAGVDPALPRGRRAAVVDGRRDPRGAIGPRAGQGAVRAARAARGRPGRRRARAVPGADPDERRRPARRADRPSRSVRKGAAAAVTHWVPVDRAGTRATTSRRPSTRSRASGGTPLVVAEQLGDGPARVLGVIHLKDVVKEGMRERFDALRAMGIRTVMVTGDNPLTARAIGPRPASTTCSPRPRPRTSSR